MRHEDGTFGGLRPAGEQEFQGGGAREALGQPHDASFGGTMP
ncbi:hypothetical protein ACFXKC_54200 [Streptomyces sp. NPDC059340]